MIFRTYRELITIENYDERFKYLKMNGSVGEDVFGFDRYLNQMLYNSNEWRSTRRKIIVRDNGCDLAHPDHPSNGEKIVIHHINPITVEMIVNHDPMVFDPNNLVTVFDQTHRAIHFGDLSLIRNEYVERTLHDTCPWKKE